MKKTLPLTFFTTFWMFILSKIEFFDNVKGLFREAYSIQELTFDPHIAYQSFKLTAELHLTKKEVLFILEILKTIKK